MPNFINKKRKKWIWTFESITYQRNLPVSNKIRSTNWWKVSMKSMPKMSVCIKMPILPCFLCAFSGIIFLLHTCHELNSFSVLMTCIVLKISCRFPENYIREPHWPRFLKKAGVCLWLVERSSCLLFSHLKIFDCGPIW